MVQALWKPVWMFLKKLKIELPYNPTVPLVYIYLIKKTATQKDICTPKFTAALSTVAKIQKQPVCPLMDE